MKRWGAVVALAIGGMLPAGCAEVDSAIDQANSAVDKVSACTEALGLTDLNPLVDPAKLEARAEDKERRLRTLAGDVQDQDVKHALTGMADSYLQVQKERIEDAGVVAQWAKHNLAKLDTLRKVCT
ncbi:hypothetical protein ATK36_3841 [Amycolatopsis sulphurea]|uniref:Small secreted protein n=1 Tax=Amycolatopsis sulphurea TaxID=76022 RepID=A0A2A9FCR2_9PSEU|nr:hypothetical protein [Amycolatopsis sulphurea]PFG48733.1 hypothetical protein ATK36_3841 [Amycolatopsis sulphurea]